MIPSYFGKEALHWFIPQASLDLLLETNGIDSEGARRVDFLFYHPNLDNPLVIEIDGKEHESSELVDKERDNYSLIINTKLVLQKQMFFYVFF